MKYNWFTELRIRMLLRNSSSTAQGIVIANNAEVVNSRVNTSHHKRLHQPQGDVYGRFSGFLLYSLEESSSPTVTQIGEDLYPCSGKGLPHPFG